MAATEQGGAGPPVVSRDGFIFNGQFCVDVDGHTHKREDPATLYVLLNAVPPATKEGKATRKPANSDREAQFYTAQLLHYGLPSLKTRDAAKKKLLTAFGGANGRTLNVPTHILALEAEMGKEYRDLEAKLAKKEVAALNKKRKADVAGMIVDNTAEPAKKGKTSAPAPAKATAQAKTAAAPKASGLAKALPPAKTSGATKPPAVPNSSGPSKVTPKIRSKAQMQRDLSILPADVARKLLNKLLEKVPAVKDIMAEELTKWEINTLKASVAAANDRASASPLEAETDVAPAAKSKKPKAPKAEKIPKAERVEETVGNLGALDPKKWRGPYIVSAPALAEQWDFASGPLSLDLYPSSTGGHIWGQFDFGIISGVIRSRSAAPSALNVPIPFAWRGREAGEGVMTFGDNNKGFITFTSEGKITATMGADLCEEFTFSGQLRQVPKKSAGEARQAVKAWKSEWRNINWTNYEVENKSRWGGWGGEEREEKPFESDTTVGYDASDDDEDRYSNDLNLSSAF